MNQVSARMAVLGALLVTCSVISACSSSGTSNAAGTGSSAARATSGTASASHSTAGPAATRGAGGATAGAAGTKRPGGTNDPRRSIPTISPRTLATVTYGSASSADRAGFAAVAKASGGLLTSSSVRTLQVSGEDVGAVASYAVKPGLAASPTFQDQYVVQLVTALVGHATPPRFVRAGGQVMALSPGPAAVAGWFEGDHVVLVYRRTTSPDLAALALSVHDTPTGR
ncbi:MAG TPA: hypothetical protein VMT69_01005 [Kineosporiaceae bacterium]|nr:hypothetical protein [Kineosporiaceae bacterium]